MLLLNKIRRRSSDECRVRTQNEIAKTREQRLRVRKNELCLDMGYFVFNSFIHSNGGVVKWKR